MRLIWIGQVESWKFGSWKLDVENGPCEWVGGPSVNFTLDLTINLTIYRRLIVLLLTSTATMKLAASALALFCLAATGHAVRRGDRKLARGEDDRKLGMMSSGGGKSKVSCW